MNIATFVRHGSFKNSAASAAEFLVSLPQAEAVILDPDLMDEGFNMEVLTRMLNDYGHMPIVFFGVCPHPEIWAIAAQYNIRMVSPMEGDYEKLVEEALLPFPRQQIAKDGIVVGVTDDADLAKELAEVCDKVIVSAEAETIGLEGVRAFIWAEAQFSTRASVREKISRLIATGIPVVMAWEIERTAEPSSKMIVNLRPWKVVNLSCHGWQERIREELRG